MVRFSYMMVKPLSQLQPATLRTALEQIASYGYEGIELNLVQPTSVDFTTLESWLEELDLTIPSFLTGAVYSPDCCMSSKAEAARQRAVEHLIGCMEIAVRFQASLVVGLLQGLRSDEPDPAAANSRIVDCLRQVGIEAERRGVLLVIEPINHLQVGFHNSVGEVRNLISEVGSLALRPMVDTIHMNIEEKSMIQPILDCGSNLGHVHLCESNGKLLGSGHIDFGAVLQALDSVGYEGFASVKDYRSEDLSSSARSCMRYLQGLRN